MATQFEQIREQQKESWNKFSSGWDKWNTFTMAFLGPIGETIISSLELKDTSVVLDVATGTGEPGITIASLIPNGKVIGTDLSEEMLRIAQHNAGVKGLKNYKTALADACALPFADHFFDAVSCRMGFMFFPDMKQASGEMYRVLKPGGCISVAVWSIPEHNSWSTTIMSIIKKHIEVPAPMPGAPGLFRCSAPQFITNIFAESGFKNIEEKEIMGKVNFKSFDRYWEIMLDIGAPIVAAMAGADEQTKELIKQDVSELFQSQNQEGKGILDFGAIIIYGEK